MSHYAWIPSHLEWLATGSVNRTCRSANPQLFHIGSLTWGVESRPEAHPCTRPCSWSFQSPPLSLFGDPFWSAHRASFSATRNVCLVSRSVSVSCSRNIILNYVLCSGQSFTCAEALKDHQTKMKNKGHACDTWYVLLRPPYNLRLSESTVGKSMQTQQIWNVTKGRSTPVEGPKPYICPLIVITGFSAPFESEPSEYSPVAVHKTTIRVSSFDIS